MSIEAAIFPIPEVVALPGAALQLHVFEPRYRQMVSDCVAGGRMLGVAFGRATAGAHHRMKQPLSLEELLTTNQESYVPASVLGIGEIGVLARLPDGRFLVEVRVQHRARLVEYVQEVPYLVARVDILPPDPAGDPASARLFDGLLLASDALLGDKAPIFRGQLGDAALSIRRLDQIVYPILQWFQVGAAATQALYEEATDYERGARLLAWMIRYLEIARGDDEASDAAASLLTGLEGDDGDGDGDDGAPRRRGIEERGKVIPFHRPRRRSEREDRPT